MIPTNRLRQVRITHSICVCYSDAGAMPPHMEKVVTGYKLQQWWSVTFDNQPDGSSVSVGEWRDVEIV